MFGKEVERLKKSHFLASVFLALGLILIIAPFAFAQPSKPVLFSPENNKNIDDKQPTFEWENASGADNHRLVIDDDPNWANDNTYDNDGIVGDNSCTIENTLSEGYYWWKVSAENAGGENWSENTWTFIVDVTAPTPTVSVDTDPVYDGDNRQQVTITYDESLSSQPNISDNISFSGADGTWSSMGDGTWTTDNKVWKENYEITDADEEHTITVSVDSGVGTDAAGNSSDSGSKNFSVDTKNPSVSVSVSPTSISDADVGTDNFTVTATYDENMDGAIDPDISFSPDVTVDTLDNQSGSWDSDKDQYTFTYDVADAGVEESGVNVTVENAKDEAGNLQASGTKSNAFDVNTLPEATISVSPTTITDNYVGSDNFTATVTYDEEMDGTVTPDIVFVDNVLEDTLAENATESGWDLDNDQYSFHYNVADAGVENSNVDVTVENAKDAAGNVQDKKTLADAFDVDTKNATATISVSPTSISDNCVGTDNFTATATYDENMDGTIDPDISFSPDVTVDTLDNKSGSWDSDKDQYTFTYDVVDAGVRKSGVNVTIENAKDEAGNLQASGTGKH